MTDTHSAALDYIERGLEVIPLHYPTDTGGCTCGRRNCDDQGKHPVGQRWQRVSTEEDADRLFGEAQRNIGIPTAQPYGVQDNPNDPWVTVVLDVDVGKGKDGRKTLADRCAEHGELEPGPVAVTGSGGLHYWFKARRSWNIRNVQPSAGGHGPLGAGLDLRATGGQVVAPPSLHKSGGVYRWETPLDDDLPVLPVWVRDALRKRRRTATKRIEKTKAPEYITEGRDPAIFRVACQCRDNKMSIEQAVVFCRSFNAERCRPPKPDDTVVKCVRSAYQYESVDSVDPDTETVLEEAPDGDMDATSLGQALSWVRAHGADYRYNKNTARWMRWDGVRWVDESDGDARLSLGAHIDHRCSFLEGKAANAVRGGKNKITAILHEAGFVLKSTAADFDAQPDQINTESGIVDLRTGELRPHDREAMHSGLVPVKYEPGATSVLWEEFLAEIFKGDTTLVDYVQRAIGYSLTGDTSEQVFFVMHGEGSNGKGVFQHILQKLAADYGTHAQFSTFLVRPNDTVRNDLARLAGRRLVTSSETRKETKFDEGIIKQLTGGDRVVARFLFQEEFVFIPAFKLWFACNHKPKITGRDFGIWRRIQLIPFTRTFSKEEADRTLAQRLEAELPAIFSWAVRGAVEWRRVGLQPPDTVQRAVQEYQRETDDLGDFLDLFCDTSDPERVVSSSDIWNAFQQYQRESGEATISRKKFGLLMKERNFEPDQVRHLGKRGRVWKGVRLLTSEERSSDAN